MHLIGYYIETLCCNSVCAGFCSVESRVHVVLVVFCLRLYWDAGSLPKLTDLRLYGRQVLALMLGKMRQNMLIHFAQRHPTRLPASCATLWMRLLGDDKQILTNFAKVVCQSLTRHAAGIGTVRWNMVKWWCTKIWWHLKIPFAGTIFPLSMLLLSTMVCGCATALLLKLLLLLLSF